MAEPEQHSTLPHEQGTPLTHAERHPDLLRQGATERIKRRKLPDAQKASLQLAVKMARKEKENLNERLFTFKEEQREKLAAIAEEYSVTLEHCESILGHSSHFKKRHEVGSQNALLSHKAREMNSGLAPGHKYKLSEIKAALDDDEELQNLTEERLEDLKQEVRESRETKALGARPSHVSEALDISNFNARMADEFWKLHARTGAIGFGFVTRANLDCTAKPGWFVTGDAGEFVKEFFKYGMWDAMAVFESWAIGHEKKMRSVETLPGMRSECAEIILANLRYQTRRSDISMSYANYDTNIVLSHKVQLVGWPALVPFAPPSTFERSEHVRDLLAVLRSGECRWRNAERKDLELAKKEVENKPKKVRARRSDQGSKRGPRAKKDATDGEARAPKRKAQPAAGRVSKKQKVTDATFSSPEMVPSDSE
ncbi:hypothetical protein C8J56DRAFT_1049936 [Mycena floridula]|nr:hypothetical protein C8J56DRAFT_1049936 [Mycena floridula]